MSQETIAIPPYKTETIEVRGRDKTASVKVMFTKVVDRPLQITAQVFSAVISTFTVDEDIRSVLNGEESSGDVEEDMRAVEDSIIQNIKCQIDVLFHVKCDIANW